MLVPEETGIPVLLSLKGTLERSKMQIFTDSLIMWVPDLRHGWRRFEFLTFLLSLEEKKAHTCIIFHIFISYSWSNHIQMTVNTVSIGLTFSVVKLHYNSVLLVFQYIVAYETLYCGHKINVWCQMIRNCRSNMHETWNTFGQISFEQNPRDYLFTEENQAQSSKSLFHISIKY